ncbi:MAG: 50S ribosomal protein L6 [Candidatus Pacebacteria bacterium]|jgi:large subunit ribosomal protein L6|nr:50S ribosomal protein L6 [Candidatus Paceibacterota bacterium]
MSKIGKQHISIPDKTQVVRSGATITIQGPKGTLARDFKDNVVITIENNEVTFAPAKNDTLSRALWGTYASHIKNMIHGVNEGFEKKLILEGVGFKSEVAGTTLNLALGFSHPVKVAIPDALKVTAEKNVITVTGIDKELVGQFTAKIRAMKKPEPYKGKGFRYDTEVIRRKQGKKTA